MGAIATTISEQIELLRERGMIIKDETKAKEVLADIGYYRLGFYWFPFEKSYPEKINRDHSFVSGTNFDNIVKLYYFDFKLRNILSQYLNRVEINFRTRLIYTVSNKHKNSPTWFADRNIVNPQYAQSFGEKVYTETFKNFDTIKNHHISHINDIYAPAWKTIEFMTLGSVAVLWENLRDEDVKLEIAKDYNLRTNYLLKNYINVICKIRNACAHGKVLFDFTLSKSIKRGPLKNLQEADFHNLYGSIRVLAYMVKQVSVNRYHDMIKELNNLICKYQSYDDVWRVIETASGLKKFV